MKNTTQQLGRFALSSVAVAALSLGAVNAWALGLGRLSVQSSLGETLRAEIDVTSLTPEEAGNLKINSVDVPLRQVIEEVQEGLQTQANDRSIELKPIVCDTHLVVRADRARLVQVIRNLIENARSFSPPGGLVTVTLSRLTSPRGPAIRVTVEDEGPGIPPDKLEKIFQRFYTDRPVGAKFGNNSGLGLSIVRQITETHRGAVWAENRMTDGNIAGARFIVDLPPAPLDI